MKELHFYIMNGHVLVTHRIKMSDNEYSELSNARKVLSRILNHEELYDQVIESYVDAKSVMYEMSVRVISNSVTCDYVKNHDCRSKLNRLFFNSLNLSKRYLDDHYREHKNIDGNIVKITCFVNKITDSENDKEEIKSHRDKIYHENSEYVVGCELRNYVQHASLPVRTFTSGFRTRPEDNQNFAVFHVPLDKQALIDGGVNKNKLSNYGDKIDLHEIMDGYIYAISEMHLKSRSLVKNKMDESIEVINAKRRQVELEYDCLLNDIDVVDTEKGERLFSLNLEWFSVVKHLQSKNSHLLNFKRFTHRPYQQI
ncbi:hypothetical protein [Shewanella seohaensis]|uniref:hypothetical protein n=1 Tax=Shewanella seohaensis TaxID=755175 RepID=UPI00200C8E61|nr:hypothetical protein [Shewanella seohaensis]MCL1119418.1 hypothetical protein [Shewanella seohaensis]